MEERLVMVETAVSMALSDVPIDSPVSVSDNAVILLVPAFPSVMAPVAVIVTASPAAVTVPSAIFPELVISISALEPSAVAEVRVRAAMVLSIYIPPFVEERLFMVETAVSMALPDVPIDVPDRLIDDAVMLLIL